jgi:hypothetical protein
VVQRSGIFPSLTKGEVQIVNGWSADEELYVVPRGMISVSRVELDHLAVAVMRGVIATSVAEVDAANEGDVIARGLPSNDHHLLMMRATSSHSFVEKDFATGRGDFPSESPILF